jgi:glucose-6-phosphate 1-dehydrogenase
LTKRLVVPALYHPVQVGKLADKFAVVGVDQDDRTDGCSRGGRAWCHQR